MVHTLASSDSALHGQSTDKHVNVGPAEEDVSPVKLRSSVKKSQQVSDSSQSCATVVIFIATVTSYSPRENIRKPDNCQ